MKLLLNPLSTLNTLLFLLTPALGQSTTPAPTAASPTPTPVSCSLTSLMPTCGIACISSAAQAIGCTAVMDFTCHCARASQMQAAVMPCVQSACGASAPVVGSVANAICTSCVSSAAAAPAATGAS